MALSEMNYVEGGGSTTLTNVGTVRAKGTSSSIQFDLSSISGAEDFVLFENMIPVVVSITYGSNSSSSTTMGYAYSYDSSTKKLTFTKSGTSNVWFSTEYNSALDIYVLT